VEQSKYVFGQVDMPAASSARSIAICSTSTTASPSAAEARLIWPALEHCLKCSHLFNILDSSNSIGVTERTAYILRVRQLAVGIAKAYVERAAAAGARRRADGSRAAARNRLRGAAGELAAGLTTQIGEIVARSCASIGCRRKSPVETYSTPRRLTVRVGACRAADRSRGAGQRAAGVGGFKPDGTPTPARRVRAKQGVEVARSSACRRRKASTSPSASAARQGAVDVLPDVLGGTLRG
jgi:hypothetical protein